MENQMTARVLLVDDEEDFIENLSDRLSLRGLSVTSATRGAEALKLTDTEQFDLIILDLAMPGMDGLETLRRIRTKHPDTEVIMLTGHGSVKSGVEAIKLGAEDFLEKPVQMDELLQKIHQARNRRVLILERKSMAEIEEILKSKAW